MVNQCLSTRQKELFDFLGLEENLIMHWTNLASWAMAQHMHALLSWKPPNVSLEQCNSFHLLVMKLIPSTIKASFQFMLMWFKIGCGYQSFFPLSVVLGSSVDNLTQILMQALMHERGLTKDLVSMNVITFSANGVFAFQSTTLNVTQQISNGWAPHFHGASLHGSQNQFGNSTLLHL
jgi:hypothetical protein